MVCAVTDAEGDEMDRTPRTRGERRCWDYAYRAALDLGWTEQQACAYAITCLLAYRREVD